VNPASGGANALIDFGAAESFALLPTTWTVGAANGQAFSVSQYFHPSGGTSVQFHPVPQNERTATVRTTYGIPATQTVAGDLHQTILTIDVLATPTVSAVCVATSGFVRAQGSLATEYTRACRSM
jgi:hypothetical protein